MSARDLADELTVGVTVAAGVVDWEDLDREERIHHRRHLIPGALKAAEDALRERFHELELELTIDGRRPA